MPRRAPRRAAVVTALLLTPALTACGIGFEAQTNQPYQPAVGDNSIGEEVRVLSAVVFSTSTGEGTFSAALVNGSVSEEITLTGITGEELEVTMSAPVVLGPEQLVDLTPTGNVYVEGEAVQAGRTVPLTLEFDNGETFEMVVPVVDEEGVFSDVEPASPPDEGGQPTEPEPIEPEEGVVP